MIKTLEQALKVAENLSLLVDIDEKGLITVDGDTTYDESSFIVEMSYHQTMLLAGHLVNIAHDDDEYHDYNVIVLVLDSKGNASLQCTHTMSDMEVREALVRMAETVEYGSGEVE